MGKSFCVETLGSKSGAAAMPESSHFVCLCPLPCMWLGGWGTLLGYEKLQRRSWAVGRGRHFCRLLSGLEMKTTRTTKYRSLSSPLFGHLQAKCWVVVGGTWLRITSWSLLGGAAPGHTGDEDTGWSEVSEVMIAPGSVGPASPPGRLHCSLFFQFLRNQGPSKVIQDL